VFRHLAQQYAGLVLGTHADVRGVLDQRAIPGGAEREEKTPSES
jgi:hypothetical protein